MRWRDSHIPNHKISDTGIIVRKRDGYVRAQFISGGYKFVVGRFNGERKTVYVHKAVAIAFIKNPLNKPQVNHIDSNRLNNNVINLEWVTAKENIQHSVRVGRQVNAKKTKCKCGLPYSGKDVLGRRICNACRKINGKKWYDKHGLKWHRARMKRVAVGKAT